MSHFEKMVEDLERIRGIKPLKQFLIVDDDITDCEWMKRVLEQRGAKVEFFLDVDRAIDKIGHAHNGSLSRIFLDLVFPIGKQGTDMLEFLKYQEPHIPVTVVSGSSVPELVDKVHELGHDFVCKQCSPEEFRHELEKYL